jgi:hypothetical protein
VLVLLLIVAVAILCGVVVVAMGRGGELARPAADVRPLDGEIMTAADVALLRPPAALWGYDMRATDEALNMVARTVTERDVEIAILRRQIAELEATAKEPWAPAKPPPPARSQASPPHQARSQASPPHQARSQASPPHQARSQGPARPPAKGVSGPLPSPFSHGTGGARPAGEASPWSAWQRPGVSPSPATEQPPEQEPGEERERERGTG